MKTTYREFWMGHTGRNLEESYFRGEVETHLAEYRKAIPYLSISAPDTQELTSLAEKIKFLEANGKRKDEEIAKLHGSEDRLTRLEKELTAMQQLLKKVLEQQ